MRTHFLVPVCFSLLPSAGSALVCVKGTIYEGYSIAHNICQFNEAIGGALGEVYGRPVGKLETSVQYGGDKDGAFLRYLINVDAFTDVPARPTDEMNGELHDRIEKAVCVDGELRNFVVAGARVEFEFVSAPESDMKLWSTPATSPFANLTIATCEAT